MPKVSKETASLIEDFISANTVLNFVSAGDPHGEKERVKMLVDENNLDPSLQLVVAAGDYLHEPPPDKASSKQNVLDVLDCLRKSKKRTLVLGGNYEFVGTAWEAFEAIGEPLFPIGGSAPNDKGVYPGNFYREGRFTFLGAEGSNPINGRFAGERSEDELTWALNIATQSAGAIDFRRTVLVTHAPPFNLGSRDELGHFGLPPAYWGKHVGSTALLNFLSAHRPLIHDFGHVHEGVGATLCVWRDGESLVVTDMRIEATNFQMAVVLSTTSPATICINHGTLENWECFRYSVAESEHNMVVRILKRRLGGKDSMTKFLDNLSGKSKGASYDRLLDPFNQLPELTKSMRA